MSDSAQSSRTSQLVNLLPNLPVDTQNEPVFAEPWQAQAFAMAVSLNEAGLFTWSEWAHEISTIIADAGPNDPPENYYRHWLTTLERMASKKSLMTDDERTTRIEEWDRAAHATPHGKAITLDVLRDQD